MADAAKVIRIELRVRGSAASGTGAGRKKKDKSEIPLPDHDIKLPSSRQSQLAASGIITSFSQLLSKGFSIYETLSYNSQEKTDMMFLNIGKTAVSSAVIAAGSAVGGVLGAAIGVAINQFVVNPVASAGAISIQRNLDQTRATNRFYQSSFAGKGNYTFDYANGGYINEDLDKVKKGSFYKKGSAI